MESGSDTLVLSQRGVDSPLYYGAVCILLVVREDHRLTESRLALHES